MAKASLDEEIEHFVGLYRDQVLRGKTRQVNLLGRVCRARVMYTLLGYELLLGKKRITCPDLITARYLKVFGELGMKAVEIPYDPTVTTRIIPRLESGFERLDRLSRLRGTTVRDAQAARRRLFRKLREQLVRLPEETHGA